MGSTHVLRNTRYLGAFDVATLEPAGDGWVTITTSDRVQLVTRPADMFATEAEARAEAKARRQPRRPNRVPVIAGEAGMAILLGRIIR